MNLIELTHKNWLEVGFRGQKPYVGYRKNEFDKCYMSFNSVVTDRRFDFKSECIRAARLISEGWGKVTLALSGGLDSEIMTRSFIEAGSDFECVTMRYWDERHNQLINSRDVASAIEVTESLNLKLRFFDINIRSIFNSGEGWRLSRLCKLNSFITIAMAQLIESSDFPVIIGAGDLIFFRLPSLPQKGVFLGEGEYTFDWHRTFHVLDRQGCPGFFYYTPELVAALLTSQEYRSFILGKTSEVTSSQAKQRLYATSFADIWLREPINGCEDFNFKRWNAISYLATRENTEMHCAPNYNFAYVTEIGKLLSKLGLKDPRIISREHEIGAF